MCSQNIREIGCGGPSHEINGSTTLDIPKLEEKEEKRYQSIVFPKKKWHLIN